MSKTFTYNRFDVVRMDNRLPLYNEASDGNCVKAQDAINREAVNADRIRVLELQLKESRAKCKGLQDFLDNANNANKRLSLQCTNLNNLYNNAKHECGVKDLQLHLNSVRIDELERIVNNR